MNVLTNDQIRIAAPSVFAERPHHEVSDKYQFVPTIQVIDELRKHGFQPVRAEQSYTRIPGKKPFTKHLLRFAMPDATSWSVGDSRPEIVLVNSHDRSSAYSLMAGIFRMVCSNGMIVADSMLENFKQRHSGDILENVINATYRIIEDVPLIAEKIETFQEITLEQAQQEALAEAALLLKWDSKEEAPISPRHLLTYRRHEDRGDSLWLTYNRVQENLLQGGLRGRTQNNRRTRTRKVKAISEDVRLNKALWTLTEKMAELK